MAGSVGISIIGKKVIFIYPQGLKVKTYFGELGGHSGRSGSFRAGWWSKITIFQIDFKFAQEVGFYA